MLQALTPSVPKPQRELKAVSMRHVEFVRLDHRPLYDLNVLAVEPDCALGVRRPQGSRKRALHLPKLVQRCFGHLKISEDQRMQFKSTTKLTCLLRQFIVGSIALLARLASACEEEVLLQPPSPLPLRNLAVMHAVDVGHLLARRDGAGGDEDGGGSHVDPGGVGVAAVVEQRANVHVDAATDLESRTVRS